MYLKTRYNTALVIISRNNGIYSHSLFSVRKELIEWVNPDSFMFGRRSSKGGLRFNEPMLYTPYEASFCSPLDLPNFKRRLVNLYYSARRSGWNKDQLKNSIHRNWESVGATGVNCGSQLVKDTCQWIPLPPNNANENSFFVSARFFHSFHSRATEKSQLDRTEFPLQRYSTETNPLSSRQFPMPVPFW